MENPIQNTINKNLLSMKMIISKINPIKRFSICPVWCDEILKQIKNLDTQKVIQQNKIPAKLLKENFYFFSDFLHRNANQCIKKMQSLRLISN